MAAAAVITLTSIPCRVMSDYQFVINMNILGARENARKNSSRQNVKGREVIIPRNGIWSGLSLFVDV